MRFLFKLPREEDLAKLLLGEDAPVFGTGLAACFLHSLFSLWMAVLAPDAIQVATVARSRGQSVVTSAVGAANKTGSGSSGDRVGWPPTA